jgi:hypothetical protein
MSDSLSTPPPKASARSPSEVTPSDGSKGSASAPASGRQKEATHFSKPGRATLGVPAPRVTFAPVPGRGILSPAVAPPTPAVNAALARFRNGRPLTNDEVAYVLSKNGGPIAPPPLSDYFKTTLNKNNVKETYLQSAKSAIAVIIKARGTRGCGFLYRHNALKRQGQWHKYDNRNLAAVIAICCTRAFFGYDCSLPNMFTMRQYWNKCIDNEEHSNWFESTVINLLDYVMKWINNNANVTFDDVLKINIQLAESRIKSRRRCQFGVFSNTYINRSAGHITSKHHAIVQGHLWEWALIFDLILPGFRALLNPKRFFLCQSELEQLFLANDGKRLYDESE